MQWLSDSTQEQTEYKRKYRSSRLKLIDRTTLQKLVIVVSLQADTAKRSMHVAEKL